MQVLPQITAPEGRPLEPGQPGAARRERLLIASAQASRLLLESSDAMSTMAKVLRLLGEAADVDRTTLAIAEVGAGGERYLVIKSEWTAPGITPSADGSAWNERRSDCFCTELKAGRSVYVCGVANANGGLSIASNFAKSSMIVPFLVDGEYAGAVGFDALRAEREFDPAAVAALEIAAGVIGAALHRERLIDAVRRERANAAEQRAAELARTNAALRSNIEQLATQPADFFAHVLLESARQAGADAATAVVQYGSEELTVAAHVRDGQALPAPFATSVPAVSTPFMEWMLGNREPLHFEIETSTLLASWSAFYDYHHHAGHKSLYVLPLVFGERNIGFVALAFAGHEALSSERFEMLIALAQQATLAIGMKRLAFSAKQSAVLAERNRIGREIHDGLAQAFTGVLLQIGAAEEQAHGTPLADVLNRIRDIAREGLQEARRSVLALRPDEPRPGGLSLALRQLAERSVVPGRTNAAFDGGDVTTGLPPEHEHALLRIAQEAVINAVRHAQPRNVQILLHAEPDALVLRIVDDGCGMQQQPELSAQQGFGLTNMRERAESIGGQWQLDSTPGEGTRVSVRIPRPAQSRSLQNRPST